MAAILGLALVSVSAVVYNASVPISSQEIAGYVQLTNNGIPGPCRGDSPTDNDRERWQPNVIVSIPPQLNIKKSSMHSQTKVASKTHIDRSWCVTGN